ncbi:MAG: type II toxin-antitoxin system VapB family antitoxin [Actinobacteria bacterium]|nr:type II toxin-antitoxin system VapB family antitoxin [Actinomycetota bacterium]
MATNLAIDDKLILQALKIGHHKTKKEAVTTALREYITHKKQEEITSLFGKVEFDEKYDYKKARKR